MGDTITRYETCRCGCAVEWDAYKQVYDCESCGNEFLTEAQKEKQEKQEVKVEKVKCENVRNGMRKRSPVYAIAVIR